jgi:hypothetical protein
MGTAVGRLDVSEWLGELFRCARSSRPVPKLDLAQLILESLDVHWVVFAPNYLRSAPTHVTDSPILFERSCSQPYNAKHGIF